MSSTPSAMSQPPPTMSQPPSTASSQPSTSTAKRPKSRDLTRDDRIRVQTLRGIGWTYQAIAAHLKFTQRQVQNACSSDKLENPDTRKRDGRKPRLSKEQVDELVAFISASEQNRKLTYKDLVTGPFKHWGIGESSIRRALLQRGVDKPKGKRKSKGSEES